MGNELEQQILDSLEQFGQRLDHIEEKLEMMDVKNDLSNILSQEDMNNTRKISEELVDNLTVEDIPAINFTLENNDKIVDFQSFAALKRIDNLVPEFNHSTTSSQSEIAEHMVEKMEEGTIDIDGLPLSQNFELGEKRHMGFTSTHLILLISSLSSIILFILGVFFIVD